MFLLKHFDFDMILVHQHPYKRKMQHTKISTKSQRSPLVSKLFWFRRINFELTIKLITSYLQKSYHSYSLREQYTERLFEYVLTLLTVFI